MNSTLVNQTSHEQNNHTQEDLAKFLSNWDQQYQQAIKKIDLFQAEKTKHWSQEQITFFIKVFYHLRGHFSDFLWYMGSFAPNKKAKELILSNIIDEFNFNGLSHEQLYLLFASAFNVDLTYELLDNTAYLPFARDYIEGQLRWLRANDWDSRLIAFAAIERLDNVDYANFRDLAVSIGAQKKDLTFFFVHINADHFDAIFEAEFKALWLKNETLVRNIFDFIFNYQINMFTQFSNAIFNV